jgi:hypothetical protein
LELRFESFIIFASYYFTVPNLLPGLWASAVSVFAGAWTGIKAFFVSLWNGIVSVVLGAANWINGIWTAVYTFFTSIWTSIVSVVLGIANWLGELWTPVAATFTAAWGYVYTFFVWIWDGIKGVIQGFIDWVGGAIEFIIAPFTKVAEVVGGVIDGIGAFFKEIIGESDTAGTKIGENLAKAQPGTTVNPGLAKERVPAQEMAKPRVPVPAPDISYTTTPGIAAAVPVPTVSGMTVGAPTLTSPVLTVPEAVSGITAINQPATANATGNRAAISLSPAKMNTPTVSNQASSAFTHALGGGALPIAPSVDIAALTQQVKSNSFVDTMPGLSTPVIPTENKTNLQEQAALLFQEAMPKTKSATPDAPRQQMEQKEKTILQSLHVENLYVNTNDLDSLLEFVRTFMLAVHKPEEEAV